jgi:type I restriction enzyme S subunit
MKDGAFTADRLLALYDRVAEAEDAIPRLRRFVLDLAVRGKLVEQDPSDEPAAELLKRIAGTATHQPARRGKQRDTSAANALEELPFDAPEGWTFAALGQLVRVLNGRAYKQQELLSSGTPVLRVGNLFTSNHWYYSDLELDDDKYCEAGDLIYAWSASFGPFIWDGPRSIFHYHIWKLPLVSEADLNKRYLFLFLQQKTREIKEAGHGISMVHMTKEKMEKLIVPLPPLAEQQRIVAKVDELMALCDRLQAARAGREAVRDRLTAATLTRLTAPETDAETFPTHARFALQTLSTLTTRPDQIKTLRQAILNLAVRGKLVAQDSTDEPAAELLKRIAKDFAAAVRDGRLNKPKDVKPIGKDDYLFDLPRGWALARFNMVASIETNMVNPKHYPKMPHVAPDNIESWTARLLPYTSIENAGVFSGKHFFRAGAILYSKIRPNLAKVTKVDFDGLCSADMYPVQALIDRDFLVLYMITGFFVNQSVSEDNRVAMPKINQAALSDILVPVPPLAEQHRIVAKVDALMALCDQLESSLTTATTTRSRLLEALLHEALGGAPGDQAEAAA